VMKLAKVGGIQFGVTLQGSLWGAHVPVTIQKGNGLKAKGSSDNGLALHLTDAASVFFLLVSFLPQ
jgi:hypothetical protein